MVRMLAEPSFRMAHVGRRKHVHTLQSRNAAKPFRLAAQFSQRRCGNRSCRGRSKPLRTASRFGGSAGRRRSTAGQRQAEPALCHSRRVGDVDGLSECRRLRPGRCLGRGHQDPRRRATYTGGHRGRDRCHRPHRDARLHRYASPPVRNGAAQLSRGRSPYQRRLRHAERQHDLLRVHPEQICPVYRPQDVYINELFGGLSQLDDGVTTVHDVSQRSVTRRRTRTPPFRR
jgi:hypothetical protein